jgi:hypothetical protein
VIKGICAKNNGFIQLNRNKNGGITVPPFLLNAEALIAIFFHCVYLMLGLSIEEVILWLKLLMSNFHSLASE